MSRSGIFAMFRAGNQGFCLREDITTTQFQEAASESALQPVEMRVPPGSRDVSELNYLFVFIEVLTRTHKS